MLLFKPVYSLSSPTRPRMAGRQQQQEGWGPDRHSPSNPEDGLDVPISVPLVSQTPALDDQRDGIGNHTEGKSGATTNSISSRNTHELLREVDGRQYNAQNTIYFLPAGTSSWAPLRTPHSHGCQIYLYMPSCYARGPCFLTNHSRPLSLCRQNRA